MILRVMKIYGIVDRVQICIDGSFAVIAKRNKRFLDN